MINKKVNFKIPLLFLLLFFCTAIKAQNNENEPPPGFGDGEQLNEVPINAYDPPPDFAWDYNWDNYGNDTTPHTDNPDNEPYYNGGDHPNGGGGGTGNGGNRQTASKVKLNRKVKPGETHTQEVKVIRDPNTSTEKKVVDLIINGEKVGTVTFSEPVRDANGVDIYSKMTVEVFPTCPIAITDITFDNPETSKFADSNRSTNGNLDKAETDLSLYQILGIINFTAPVNEEENLIITGNITAATDAPTNKKDPCAVAKELTTLGTSPVFQKAVQDIGNTPDLHSVEHSISLGKNSSGQIFATDMKPGDEIKVVVNYSIQGFFANLHNHPNSSIHSGKDLYNITFFNKFYPNYIGSLVLPNKEEVYAAVVTDLAAAQAFAAKYLTDPITKESAHYPDFMRKEMSQVFKTMNSYSIESESRAKAFVFSRYNSGITFFRQNNDGTFYPLLLKETKQTNNSKRYTLIPCS